MKYFRHRSRYWRVHTPLMLQMQSIECGAASLGMILGYFGKKVSLGELRDQCNVSRDGSNALDIFEAAKLYGLEGTAYEVAVQGLEELKSPAILLWENSHFVVLEGFSKKKVYINDPAHGHVSYLREAFTRHYSGIALHLEPTDAFVPSKEGRGFLGTLCKKWVSLSTFIFLFLSGALLLLPSLVIPIVLRLFIDHLPYANGVLWKVEWLVALAGALFLSLLFKLFYRRCMYEISSRCTLRLSSRLFAYLLRLPLSFYEQRDPREMARRLQLGQTLSRTLFVDVIPASIQLFFSLIFACILFAYDALLAAVTLVGAILSLLVMYQIDRRTQSERASLEKEIDLIKTFGMDTVHSLETVKALGSEEFFFARRTALEMRALAEKQKIGKKDRIVGIFPHFTQLFCTALLLAIGYLHVMSGALTLGMLAAMQVYLLLFLEPFTHFARLSDKIQKMRKDLSKIEDILHTSQDVSFVGLKIRKVLAPASLKFHEVGFGYLPLSPPFLKKLSFSLAPGEWMGVTGKTGSGKTTLGKLAAQLLYPKEGVIFYGDFPLKELNPEEVRKQIAWVGHQSYLFSGTLRDNLFSPKSSDAERKVALQKARLFKSLHFPVVEEGKNLCFAERQQLEFARIFLSRPSLLVLDEALSALEKETCSALLNTLREEGCSCLLISNQSSFLKEWCTQVLSLGKKRGAL